MIIEHHTFRLAAGVTEDRFLAADRRVQTEFSMFQYGFMRRTTARSGDDWLIETLWWFEQNGIDALASDDETVVALRACIDPATESVRRYETLD